MRPAEGVHRFVLRGLIRPEIIRATGQMLWLARLSSTWPIVKLIQWGEEGQFRAEPEPRLDKLILLPMMNGAWAGSLIKANESW